MRQLTRVAFKDIALKEKYYEKYLNKEEIKFIKEYSPGWMDKYKDAWHLINK